MQTIIVFLNWAEKGVLILLAVLSIWSVGIMIDRRRVFRKSYRANDIKEAERFINNRDPSEATVTKVESNRIMSTLMSRLLNNPNQTLESLEPDFRNWLHGQKLILSKHLNVLATLGANAPFIGLLGTVFGIIEAFSELSNQQSGSNAVMASIAEALIATAMGLFVAIPAVIAYNYFSHRLKTVMGSAEALKNLYLSKLPTTKR